MVPGEYILEDGEIEINPGRPVTTLTVTNTGDRPVQVGSHYHFFETNRELVFDRPQAYGKRLDLPSGTAVRFEPGDVKEVRLIPYAGHRVVFGFNALVEGRLDDPYTHEASLKRCVDQKFGHKDSGSK